MSRKLLVLVSLVTVAAMLLSGCATPPAPTKAPEPAATTKPAEPPAAWEPKYNTTAPSDDYGGEFKSIEALDQYTVKFTLNAPDPAFLYKVAFGAFDIHSAKQLEATGGGGEMLDHPIGTGAYVLKEWVRGDHVTLVPNPNYWGEKPKNETVVIRWNAEAATRLLELQSGQADCIDDPSPDDLAKIQADPSLKLMPRPAVTVLYLAMNNKHKPFDDEKVRRAVAMAIDKQSLVENYYPAGSIAAEQFMPPAVELGYSEGLKWYDYDVEGAKALLAEAGYPDGFEFTLSYGDAVRGYIPLPDKIAQEIQSQLAKVGIRVKLEKMQWSSYLAATAAGERGLFLLGWHQDYADPTNWVDYHFTGASDNFGKPYPDLVEAIRKAAQEPDPAKRHELYKPVNELIKQHVPMVPLAHGTYGIVYNTVVEGAHVSPLNNEEFRVMSIPGRDQINWVQNAEPTSLYTNDETDGESLRVGNQIFDTLYWYKLGTAELVPALAESYDVSDDLMEWTFHLRKDVKFSDGTPMDANDVVATFVAMWDAASPMHKGNTGVFEYLNGFFGSFLNAPEE